MALTKHGDCHIWTGQMKQGKPYLKGVGNPVRHLLGIETDRIQVRLDCPREDPRCIKIDHQRVIVEQNHKYDDAPLPTWEDPRVTSSGFSQAQLDEIEEEVQALTEDPTLIEFFDNPDPRVKEEILRRVQAT
ncbi:hypothetical protein [Mesorhizobium sp. WSM2239]|uniref:Uncharacterized protein n=2 Tax=unclassified Mesorhizobium TaxID=325217 RepID=A0AAU8DF04_9HYPH